MSDYLRPEITDYSNEARAKFLSGLKTEKEGVFESLEENEFLRFAGIPNQLIIDELNSVPEQERLAKALELGMLDSPRGANWSFVNDRPIVFTKMGGQKIPFYRSSKGTGGAKNAGTWYPFFGLGEENWLIKGGGDNFESGYNNPLIQKMQNVLGESFNWDHDLDLHDQAPNEHPFKNTPGFCPPEKIDSILYGQEKLYIDDHSPNLAIWIQNIMGKMPERYSGEAVGKIVAHNLLELRKNGLPIK